MTMRVSTDVLSVLDRATCEGNALSLVALGQLDRKLYTDTNKVLEAAGGKWNRKARAHLFEGDAAEAVEPIILTGEVVLVKQEFGQFYTPPDVAERVVKMARLKGGMTVLEPSAGRGALAAPAFLAGAVVDCVEIDARNVHILASTAYRSVTQGDFLQAKPKPAADRVLMNPPFARQDDIRHVMHAAKFLKPGGRLVAIMSAGTLFRSNRLAEEFRAFREERGATVEELPQGAFKSSGTSVNACIVSFDARPA